MCDIVVLRNLVRATSVRDQSVDFDNAFRKVAFGSRLSFLTRWLATALVRMYSLEGCQRLSSQRNSHNARLHPNSPGECLREY